MTRETMNFVDKYASKLSTRYFSLVTVQSFQFVNGVYTRKRGMHQTKLFAYINEMENTIIESIICNKGNRTYINSPIMTLNYSLQNLMPLVQTQENTTRYSIHSLDFQRVLIITTRIFDDRINNLLNTRDLDTIILTNSLIIMKELSQIKSIIEFCNDIISKVRNKEQWKFQNIYSLITFILDTFIPKLISRIEITIRKITDKQTNERLLKYFQNKNVNEFVSFWLSKSDAYKNQSENIIVKLMINDSSSQKTLKLIKLLSFDLNYLSRILTIWTNIILDSLFTCILECQCPFDEFGVYKLFRIILKYQDFVISLKKMMGVPTHYVLVTDNSIWIKAEEILQLLNNAVFEKSKVNSCCFNINVIEQKKISSDSSSRMLIDTKEKWHHLVINKQKTFFSCLKGRKLRGTVFVSLQIPLNGL